MKKVAFKWRPECVTLSNHVSGVYKWIYKQLDATFLPLVGNKMKIWWQTIENGDESPKPFEFLFPFALFWRVEERFVEFVSLGTAGPHHFLSRLKTRAWNVSDSFYWRLNPVQRRKLLWGNQSWWSSVQGYLAFWSLPLFVVLQVRTIRQNKIRMIPFKIRLKSSDVEFQGFGNQG